MLPSDCFVTRYIVTDGTKRQLHGFELLIRPNVLFSCGHDKLVIYYIDTYIHTYVHMPLSRIGKVVPKSYAISYKSPLAYNVPVKLNHLFTLVRQQDRFGMEEVNKY